MRKKKPTPVGDARLVAFLERGIAAQRAVDNELAKLATCEACQATLEGVIAEPGREYLCPRCFSALTPDERKRGVVKKPPNETDVHDAPLPAKRTAVMTMNHMLALGRPETSGCACFTWPCPCPCHARSPSERPTPRQTPAAKKGK